MGYADLAAVDPTAAVASRWGMDSLMAVRIRNTARADFGVEPPVALLLQGASLQTSRPISSVSSAWPRPRLRGTADQVRDRAQQRAAARQEAALRRKRGQRV